METFSDLNLTRALFNSIEDLGFNKPTPIQAESFSVILSGKDVVGIAQTGTGKTLAYMLPLLRDLKFSKQVQPRILIIVPTRELVLQVVEQINDYAKYMTVRALGVYGGTNINTQAQYVAQGCDILVGTPGRVYDLALTGILQFKSIKQLVIDEVDIMLDQGFRYQLTNILDLLPERRQNIMFSATMTEEVDELIHTFFINPSKISIAVSGTRLENIEQTSYELPNFYTKVNLLKHILKDKQTFSKILVFVSTKKMADLLYASLEGKYAEETSVMHSNKSQNFRIRSIEEFEQGKSRILISTEVMARGLDLDKISHVINFDTPQYPENYMHRIGRTGRAEQIGHSILFTAPKETEFKTAIELLMDYNIPLLPIPEEIKISEELAPFERPADFRDGASHKVKTEDQKGPSFHEKKAKNNKTNQGGSYRKQLAAKYKKPQTRGDKNMNRRKKKK